jgi:hypothetical protein
MNRHVLNRLSCTGVALLFIACASRGPRESSVALDDADVASVTAEVFAVDGLTRAVPPTVIPKEHVSRILDTLRPMVSRDYPEAWDKSPIGKLSIKRHDGSIAEVAFPHSGQNALCFRLIGTQYMRGGQYEPVLEDGDRPGYGDESLMLTNAIREIHEEQASGKKSAELPEIFQDFERSAGKRPPR